MTAPRPIRAALLSVAVTLLGIGALELGLGAAGYRLEPEEFQFNPTRPNQRPGMLLVSPTRFFELAPHYRLSAGHAGAYATESWPFRGRPPEPAPEGIRRVALLGDSCTYGLTLDAAHSLAEQLQERLARRGLDPTRVQVLNFGVPGYTTVQMELLLQEVLERWQPDEVVLYPAAWNDQMTAIGHTDRELLEAWQRGSLMQAVRRTAIYGFLRSRRDDSEPADVSATETRRTRVEADEVGRRVAAMIEHCRLAGSGVTVIVPAHQTSRDDLPERARLDAQSVREAARRGRAAVVDTPELFARDGRGDALFNDIVHPAPPGIELLADHVAPHLFEVEPPPPGPAPLAIRSLHPTRASSFGDQELALELTGWDPSTGLPAVIVGGAPLLELRAVDERTVAGRLLSNAAGTADIVVQTSTGVAWSPAAVRIEPPTLEVIDTGQGRELLFRSRPGDRAIVAASRALLAEPEWQERGERWLDEAQAVRFGLDLVAGPSGAITTPLVLPGNLHKRPLYLQALVVPKGEDPASLAARWSVVGRYSP